MVILHPKNGTEPVWDIGWGSFQLRLEKKVPFPLGGFCCDSKRATAQTFPDLLLLAQLTHGL